MSYGGPVEAIEFHLQRCSLCCCTESPSFHIYLSELYLEWQGVRLCSNMGITAGLATGIIVTI